MKSFVTMVTALALISALAVSGADAAPPTAAQKAEFTKLCLKNSGGNTTLCKCKEAQLDKLIDSDFMQVVLDSMNGKTTPVGDTLKYGTYISKSNAVCAPGM